MLELVESSVVGRVVSYRKLSARSAASLGLVQRSSATAAAMSTLSAPSAAGTTSSTKSESPSPPETIVTLATFVVLTSASPKPHTPLEKFTWISSGDSRVTVGCAAGSTRSSGDGTCVVSATVGSTAS